MKRGKSVRINKKGIALETLAYILLAVAILVLMVVGYMILTGKGQAALDFIQNLFKFGG